MDTSQYLEMFLGESMDNLQTLNESLLELEQNPDDMDKLNEIFRVAHTIKGMAATMGFSDIAELTHKMEDVLSEFREGKLKVTQNVVTVLFGCLDTLEKMVNNIEEGIEDKVDITDIMNKLIAIKEATDSGGEEAAEKMAARFTDKELLVGYMQHKTGPGHNELSKMEEQKLKPSSGIRWHKPVVVLTNREVYSAANEFVKYMKCCPLVTVVGDKTGGGAGLPFSSQLPNGWSVRFSACPMYDKNKQCTEFGIEPDYKVDLDDDDFRQGKDTIIEFARKLINNNGK